MNPLLSLEQYLYLGNPLKVSSKEDRPRNVKSVPHPSSPFVGFFSADEESYGHSFSFVEFLPIALIFLALL